MNLNRHCNWTQFWHLLRCSAWILLNLILSGVKYEQQCSCVTIFPSSVKRSDPKYRLIICIAFENRYFPKLFPNTNCFLCTRPETILILKSWIENEGNVRNLKRRSEELKHREPGLWSPLWATQCPPLVSHTSCIQSSDNTTRDKFTVMYIVQYLSEILTTNAIYGVQRWMLFKALTVFNAAPTHSPVERFDTRSCSTAQ